MLATATVLLMSVTSGKVLFTQNATDLKIPLGSVYKPLAVAAMHIPDKSGFYCPGKLYVDGHNFTCSHPRLTGPMDTRTALAYSCNNFFYHFGGLKALGEGVALSPLELVQAYRRLAIQHADSVRAGMRDCVRYGTGQLANISGYEVAGKTGTPKGYAWFAGWAPADRPEVAFVVLTKHGSGGLDAAPAARVALMKYLGRESEFAIRTADGLVTLPLEEYVAGVMSGEASTMRSPEALKAMAVAARTYAVRFRGRHQDEGYDFCATTHCQNFRPAGMSLPVEATAGEMLWRKGELIDAYYSQDCEQKWTSTIRPDEMRNALREAGLKAPEHWEISVAGKDASGRVQRLSLGDGVMISAEPFRLAMGRTLGWNRLKSDFYTVSGFTFQGRGVGHGMGLCQLGAERMTGNFREILAHYYPGALVGLTAQGIDWRVMGGERAEVWSTTERKELVPLVDGLVRQVESESGLAINGRPKVQIFPSVAVYRNATGQPGWVAGSTKGSVIRVQPAGADRATLRHEMFHVAIEGNAHVTLPLWFREGLALSLAGGPVSSSAGYVLARRRVDACIERYGKGAVVGWLSSGLPDAVKRENATNPLTTRQ